MADDKENKIKDEIRIKMDEVIRLRHELNKSTTYRSKEFNAKEIEELSNMATVEYWRIQQKYAEQLKERRIIPNFGWYALSIVGVLLILGSALWYWKLLGLVCMGYSALQIGSGIGNPEGFVIGYKWGLSDGVIKALGIDDKEAKDVFRRATEMKTDEEIIKRMDERE
jgi:hypothetical protein